MLAAEGGKLKGLGVGAPDAVGVLLWLCDEMVVTVEGLTLGESTGIEGDAGSGICAGASSCEPAF